MSGVQIEYLLGLFFLVSSVTSVAGKITADTVKLVAGVILLVLALIGFSLIH